MKSRASRNQQSIIQNLTLLLATYSKISKKLNEFKDFQVTFRYLRTVIYAFISHLKFVVFLNKNFVIVLRDSTGKIPHFLLEGTQLSSRRWLN
jgi:hypothetical protein